MIEHLKIKSQKFSCE